MNLKVLDNTIRDMKVLYGVNSPVVAEVVQETHAVVDTARETQRVFKKKAVQLPIQHPALILATYLYNFISDKIHSFFIDSIKIKEKDDTLFLANSLKNQCFITQKQFILFKEAINESPEAVKEKAQLILNDLYENTSKARIDRKNYIHLTTLVSNGYIKETMQLLFALSSVSNINRFQEELKEVVQPKEQLEMIEMLKEAYDYSRFPEKSVTTFSTLTARVEIYRWLKEDTRETGEKRALLEALKDSHAKNFEKAMGNYLQSKVNVTRGLERTYYKELIQSFEGSNALNAFIHFSQALESLSVLMDWEEKVTHIETVLETMVKDKTPLTDKRTQKLLEDLKELYNIFGKILENEKEFSASHTAMGLEQGILRSKWRNIGILINKIAAPHMDAHHLCGCMFDREQQEAWPDVENTEIRPSNPVYKPDRPTPKDPQKKINVLGLYCNWGSGHRSNMQAISDSFGSDEFHFSTVDLPETTLLSKDTIHNIAGGDHSTATFYNTLLAGRYISWINFMANLNSGKPDENSAEQYRALIREQILKQRPDIILTNFAANAPYVLDVAQELGIPFLRLHTDMDVTEDYLDTHPHAYNHFKKAIPYALPDMEEYLKGKYSDDQIEVTGYPIRPAFYNLKKALEEKPSLMGEMRKKNGIKEDEVVYMVSSGGTGSDSPFPKLIAATKKGAIPKGHLYFIAGRNKDSKAELEKFLQENKESLNPDIQVHIEGFITGERMAELMALTTSKSTAGKQGIFMGKAGGGTIAEVLRMETQMLIDMEEEASISWELYAAKKLKEHGLADIVKDSSTLVQQINERCSASHGDYTLFNAHKPEERVYDLVKKMVREAERDKTFKMKRTAWETNKVFMHGLTKKGEVLNYFDSIATLNRMIRNIEHKQELKYTDEMIDRLKKNLPIAINFKAMCFVPVNEYKKDDSRLTVRYFITQLEMLLKEKKVPNEKLLFAASLYLDFVNAKHKSELKQPLQKVKSDRFLMEIAYLDRLLVNAKTESNNAAIDSLEPTQQLYKTALAQEQLKAWVTDQTSHGRNKNLKEETLLPEKEALRSFLFHPDQYNWVMDLNITRMASAYNHKLKVNEKNEVMILFKGKEKSVSELIDASLTSIGKRVVDSTKGVEYTYHYAHGLEEVKETGETLQLFKHKDRKTKDFRLEIVTDTQNGELDCAWIRLRSPDGDIYSMTRSSDPDVEIPQGDATIVLPGNVGQANQCEFRQRKVGSNLVVTKINLENAENFQRVKAYLEKLQKEGDSYHIFNKNSASLIREVGELLDIPVESKVTISEQMLPLTLSMRKIFLINPWVRDLALILFYPLTLITHLVLGIFGAFRKHDLTSPSSKPLFFSAESFFDPTRSLLDSPIQVSVWQRCAKEQVGTGILTLGQVRHYAKKISRAKILQVEE